MREPRPHPERRGGASKRVWAAGSPALQQRRPSPTQSCSRRRTRFSTHIQLQAATRFEGPSTLRALGRKEPATTEPESARKTVKNEALSRSVGYMFSLSSHVRSRSTTPSKSRGAWSPLGSGHVWACCCAARSTHDGARGGWCQGARLAESSPRPQAHSVGRSALQPRRQPQRLALALALTWGATVRGTHGTTEAGTRAPVRTARGSPGPAALCLWYVQYAGGRCA